MIPNGFMQLEKFPHTMNGKINRKELPLPDFIDIDREYIAPSNETEKELVKIWAEVLEIDGVQISITDNLFSIGGDSIKIIKILSQVYKKFNVDVPLRLFYENHI